MERFLAQTKQSTPKATAPVDNLGKQDKEAPDTPAPLPKGVVLGKDGKPCRTCTDVSAWMAMTRSPKGKSSTSSVSSASTASTAVSSSATSASQDNKQCPPDVTELGRSTWTLLHSLAASYPSTAAPSQQNEMSQFLNLFSKLYPCWVCAEDFQSWMAKEKPVLNGRKGFGDWMCRAHNEVNVKLGKEVFDCSRWEERWRVGWKDGSCD